MAVPCDVASTTMPAVAEGVTHVCAGPHSCEGGQPPQLPLQPSSPQVLPVQSALQRPGAPASVPFPERASPEAASAVKAASDEPVLASPDAPSRPPSAAALDPPSWRPLSAPPAGSFEVAEHAAATSGSATMAANAAPRWGSCIGTGWNID